MEQQVSEALPMLSLFLLAGVKRHPPTKKQRQINNMNRQEQELRHKKLPTYMPTHTHTYGFVLCALSYGVPVWSDARIFL